MSEKIRRLIIKHILKGTSQVAYTYLKIFTILILTVSLIEIFSTRNS